MDEALQAAEHHSETQAHLSISKSNSEQQAPKREIGKTISKKLLEESESYRILWVLTTIQLREFRHGVDSLKNVVQNRHSLIRMNHSRRKSRRVIKPEYSNPTWQRFCKGWTCHPSQEKATIAPVTPLFFRTTIRYNSSSC